MSQVWCAAAWLKRKPAATSALCGIVWKWLTEAKMTYHLDRPINFKITATETQQQQTIIIVQLILSLDQVGTGGKDSFLLLLSTHCLLIYLNIGETLSFLCISLMNHKASHAGFPHLTTSCMTEPTRLWGITSKHCYRQSTRSALRSKRPSPGQSGEIAACFC